MALLIRSIAASLAMTAIFLIRFFSQPATRLRNPSSSVTLTDLQSRMSRAHNGGYHGFWTRRITVVTWNTAANYHPLGFVLASLSKRRTQHAQNNVTSGVITSQTMRATWAEEYYFGVSAFRYRPSSSCFCLVRGRYGRNFQSA